MRIKRTHYTLTALGMLILVGLWAWADRPQTPPSHPHDGSGSLAALTYLNTVRSYPNADRPETGFAQAFQQVAAKSANRTNEKAWTALGPQNIGGRTLALAFNPQNTNTLYAGSASGGLWRSYSGGVGDQAWHQIATGFPVLGVAAIAIAPNDSNTIYIGTGEVYSMGTAMPGIIRRTTRGIYGIGLLKSTDGGQTWHKSIDWSAQQNKGVQKIRLNPKRPETVWAATTDGVYRSYDAGTTWTLVNPVVMATDLVINPADTSIVFAAHGGHGSSGHGLYRSRNGGQSWVFMSMDGDGPAEFEGKAMLSMSLSNPDVIYASIGKSDGNSQPYGTWLCKTTDGGDTWEVVSTVDYSRYQGWYAHDVAVHPSLPDIVWTAGVSGTPLLSTQGGKNLRPITDFGLFESGSGGSVYPDRLTHVDFHQILFHPDNPLIIYFANDGGVFRTMDGGLTFENCNGGYQTTQFYAGFANASHDSLYALGGLQDNSSALYTGSVHWTSVGGGDGGYAGIIGDTLFFSQQNLALFYSTNRGAGPQTPFPPPRTSPLFIAPFTISPANPNRLFAGSRFFYFSDSREEEWDYSRQFAQINRNSIGALAASYQDENMVYVATAPGSARPHIYRSEGDLEVWTRITDDLPDRFYTDLVVDPTDDTKLYVTLGGFGTSHLFRWTQVTAEWQDLGQGLPDIPTWSVIVDPLFPHHIYLGNDLGVFASFDDGASWHQLTEGLPDAVVAMDLVISPLNRKLRVATHGNGAYEFPLETQTLTSTEQPLLTSTVLAAPYPNPFSNAVTIPYELNEPQEVNLAIFNPQGRQVAQLVQARQTAGQHEVQWNATALAAGTYYIRLSTPMGSFTKPLTLVR